jgi:hypothetical protein
MWKQAVVNCPPSNSASSKAFGDSGCENHAYWSNSEPGIPVHNSFSDIRTALRFFRPAEQSLQRLPSNVCPPLIFPCFAGLILL